MKDPKGHVSSDLQIYGAIYLLSSFSFQSRINTFFLLVFPIWALKFCFLTDKSNLASVCSLIDCISVPVSLSPEHSCPIAALDSMQSLPSEEVYQIQQTLLVFLFLTFLLGRCFTSVSMILLFVFFFF